MSNLPLNTGRKKRKGVRNRCSMPPGTGEGPNTGSKSMNFHFMPSTFWSGVESMNVYTTLPRLSRMIRTRLSNLPNMVSFVSF